MKCHLNVNEKKGSVDEARGLKRRSWKQRKEYKLGKSERGVQKYTVGSLREIYAVELLLRTLKELFNARKTLLDKQRKTDCSSMFSD